MKQKLIFLGILLFGFTGIFVLSKSLEAFKPGSDAELSDEDLYFSANQLKLVDNNFKGLIADYYWIKSLQYIGNKLINYQESISIDNLRPLNPRLLYPMLDTAATLDPQFLNIYDYGASILPAIDNQQAVDLLKKGIAQNPDEWKLYHNLGYIYWQMKDYRKASEYYSDGSTKKDAPVWMKQMSGTMLANGGSREFALQIYKQMFETAEDEQTKNFAELRYNQVIALAQLDIIRPVLQSFHQKNNRCPQNWREFTPYLVRSALPENDWKVNNNGELVDPSGIPFQLSNKNGVCDAKIATDSKIPPPIN